VARPRRRRTLAVSGEWSCSKSNTPATTKHIPKLTHYRPAMPFGKTYFRGSFQFSFVTISKISPLWKPDIQLFRHFPKLKIVYLKGKNYPSGNLKFYLGIFQSLKLRI